MWITKTNPKKHSGSWWIITKWGRLQELNENSTWYHWCIPAYHDASGLNLLNSVMDKYPSHLMWTAFKFRVISLICASVVFILVGIYPCFTIERKIPIKQLITTKRMTPSNFEDQKHLQHSAGKNMRWTKWSSARLQQISANLSDM